MRLCSWKISSRKSIHTTVDIFLIIVVSLHVGKSLNIVFVRPRGGTEGEVVHLL